MNGGASTSTFSDEALRRHQFAWFRLVLIARHDQELAYTLPMPI